MRIRSLFIDGTDMVALDPRLSSFEVIDVAPPEIGQDNQGAYESPYFQIDFEDKSRLLITGAHIMIWYEGSPEEEGHEETRRESPGQDRLSDNKHRVKLVKKT